MTAILYPVAATADAALNAPLAFAEREREASRAAAGEVVFVTEAVGPAFTSREAAQDAYAGRIEDDRPGRIAVAMDRRWCQLRAVSAIADPTSSRAPVKPTLRNGRRWPAPQAVSGPTMLWRLSISYWRVRTGDAEAPTAQARKLRRHASGRDLGGVSLDALARQPLRPALAQAPLDIGLFEYRLPENPAIVVPDE